MSDSFEQISLKEGFMKHNGGLLFRTISETEYEFKSIINKLAKLIIDLNKILNSKKELYKIIKLELNNIKDKFAVPRRTKIIDAVLNYDIEETIQKESVLITVTLQGYIKRGSLNSVKTQKRGGKGKTGITTRNEDSVVQTLSVDTHTKRRSASQSVG